MREAQTKDIDGITFTLQQLPAMRAAKLMHKLARAIGPGLLKSLSGVPDLKAVKNLDVGGAADGVQMMFDRFSEGDLEALIRELFETATITKDGKTIPLMPVFDMEMAGKMGTVLKAIRFGLEVNFGDFFGALLANVGPLAGAPPSKA